MIYQGHENYVNSILLGNNCEKLYTCSRDCTAQVFDVHSGKRLNVFTGHTKDIFDIQLNTENTLLFTCSEDTTCKS